MLNLLLLLRMEIHLNSSSSLRSMLPFMMLYFLRLHCGERERQFWNSPHRLIILKRCQQSFTFHRKIPWISSFVYLFYLLVFVPTTTRTTAATKICQMNWSNANCERIVEVYDNKYIPHFICAYKKCECDERKRGTRAQ